MGTVEESLKCPVCQELFTDPVTLPCGHDFCLTCIQAVWKTDKSAQGPYFCPECQIFLPSDLTLQKRESLCVLLGSHKNHRALQLHEACADYKCMLENTMSQLLKRRGEAEQTIKDLESLYTETVVQSVWKM